MTTPDGWMTEAEFQETTQQLDALVQAFETMPFPEVRDMAFDMLQAVDTMHRESLRRLVAFLHAHGQGALLDHAAEDPIIRTLLLLYDLVPSEERMQVETALDLVRPYLHSHGGAIDLLDVQDGVVHVRLSGACHGCAGSAMTLKRGVEAALQQGFPAFRSMEVHEPAPAMGPAPLRAPAQQAREIIPLTPLDRSATPSAPGSSPPPYQIRRPAFQAVAHISAVPTGALRAFDVDGVQTLIANIGGEFYAVRNQCPTQRGPGMAPLDLGSFTPPVIVCPWHNEAFDIRTGKRTDGVPGASLAVLPIAVVGDSIQLAVNTVADALVPANG